MARREQRVLVQNDLTGRVDPAPPPELMAIFGVTAQVLAPVVRDGAMQGWVSVRASRTSCPPRPPRRRRKSRIGDSSSNEDDDHAASDLQAGGSMEGTEVRFGIRGSVLAAVTTSNGATGSYNSMRDSYTLAGGLVTILNMLLGEVVFGGLGTSLYSPVLIALVGLFEQLMLR